MIFLDIESWIGGLGAGILILALILVIIWIWAVVDILRRPGLSLLMKVIWIAVVIGFPFAGVILYLIFGRRSGVDDTHGTRY